MKKMLFSTGVKRLIIITIIVLGAIFLSIWFVERNLSAGNIEISFETFGGEQIENLIFKSSDYPPSLPKGRKDGYYFEGWYCDKAYSEPIQKLDNIKKSTQLYAKFTEREYTITYHNVTATSNPKSYTILSDDIPLLPPAGTASDFLGWYANDKFAGAPISVIEKGSIGNLDLYARWRLNFVFPLPTSQFSSNAPTLDSSEPINQYADMGAGGYILFDNVAYSRTMTYEIWTKSSITGNYFIFDHRQAKAGLALFVYDNGRLMVASGYDVKTQSEQGVFKFNGTWHHLAVVASEDGIYIYYDNRLVAEDTSNGLEIGTQTSAPLCLGNNIARSGASFIGCIDDIRVWRSARESTDIYTYQYAQFRNEITDLIAYCSFNKNELFAFDSEYLAEEVVLSKEAPISAQNKSISFDGQHNYITIDNVDIYSQMTYEIWVRCAQSIKDQIILDHRKEDNRGSTPITLTKEGSIKFSYLDFEERVLQSPEGTFKFDNKWHHIAITISSNCVKIYYNGSLVAESDWGCEDMDARVLFVGRQSKAEGGLFFKGSCDELRIFNYTKNKEEINADMHLTLTGLEEGLALYLDCNDSLLDLTLAHLAGNYHTEQTINYPIIIGPIRPIPIPIPIIKGVLQRNYP